MADIAAERACTCRVTGPDYEQTRFDKACPYHGEGGSMLAVAKIARRYGLRVTSGQRGTLSAPTDSDHWRHPLPEEITPRAYAGPKPELVAEAAYKAVEVSLRKSGTTHANAAQAAYEAVIKALKPGTG